MKHPKHTPSTGRTSRSGQDSTEWVGGRMVAPFYITKDKPQRPDIILWMEFPDGMVVHFEVCDGTDGPASFGASLLKAMDSPMVGPRRQPAAIRVADAQLAEEVRQILPNARIIHAPTPELDRMIEQMSEATMRGEGDEEPSYFENGRIGIEANEVLFRAAKDLYTIAPWKTVDDTQVLRVDIPELDVEGACLSIIGTLGESRGLLLFPSMEGFDRFIKAADAPRSSRGKTDIGTSLLCLNYGEGADLPESMHREAMKHGWPVADASAYPTVVHLDPDGLSRPLTEKDIRIISACASSLVAFFLKYGRLFEQDRFEPVCESYFYKDGFEVRFTVPYEAAEEFETATPQHRHKAHPPQATPREQGSSKEGKVGRNQPCPCGSGKKYKLCCLGRDEARERGQYTYAGAGGERAAVHNLDRKLNLRMYRYAEERFGPDWMDHASEVFLDEEMSNELLDAWAMHHHLLDGKPLVQWFLEDPDTRLSASERTWLNAQRSAWLSVWEIVDVEPGRSLSLKDLLTGETRQVVETTASRSLVKRDAMLARVVDHDGISVLCGIYQRSLGPHDAAEVIRRARGRLRRKSNIPVDRLRDEAIGRYLIARWEDALEEAEVRAGTGPVLQNTDGDPLLLTVDHFAIDPANLPEIRRRIAAMEGVDGPPESDGSGQIYLFSRKGNAKNRGLESTVIGQVTLFGNKLKVESNSKQRADTMRSLLESALGSLITHRTRKHTDPASLMQDRNRPGGVPPKPGGVRQASAGVPQPQLSSREMEQAILEMKTKHYADWADHPLPVLDGKTPREAAATREGRRMVDTVLKDCENREAREPAGQRFDFAPIRRELGLEE